MIQVTLFTRENCHLCEAAREVIERVRQRIPFELQLIDIDEPTHEQWLDRYDHHVPVIHIDGHEFARHRLDERALEVALKSPEP
jgi:glutaredoxin